MVSGAPAPDVEGAGKGDRPKPEAISAPSAFEDAAEAAFGACGALLFGFDCEPVIVSGDDCGGSCD